MNTLPDYLKNNLDIVLVGLNPSQVSVERGHYFANPLRYSRGGGNPSPHPPRRACPREDGDSTIHPSTPPHVILSAAQRSRRITPTKAKLTAQSEPNP